MFVRKTEEDEILTLTISRPERGNALGTTIAEELSQQMKEIKSKLQSFDLQTDVKPHWRALVISATTLEDKRGKTWVAGGDLQELSHLSDGQKAKSYVGSMSRFCLDLEALPIPVVVSIDGAAIGGGAELALAGDIRIGTKDSCFLFKQLQVGLTCGYGGTKRLTHLIGKAKAQKTMYLKNKVTADEAFETGLLHEVASSKEQMQTRLKEITTHLKKIEPRAFAAQKKMFFISTNEHQSNVFSEELETFCKIWMNPTYKEFLKKFKSN